MKTNIIANPQVGELEVSISASVKVLMSVEDYERLLAKETEIGHKLFDIVRTGELPLLVKLIPSLLVDETISEETLSCRVRQIIPVLKRVLSMMEDGLHLKVIKGMISWSCNGPCVYANSPSDRFLCLYEKVERGEFWGTAWELPLRLVKGLLEDLENGLNIETPTRQECEKSQILAVARVYCCPEERIEKAYASFPKN